MPNTSTDSELHSFVMKSMSSALAVVEWLREQEILFYQSYHYVPDLGNAIVLSLTNEEDVIMTKLVWSEHFLK